MYFSRLNRFSKIGLAVFPEAKWFSGWNFPVKNEIQNSISEFASGYGMPAGDHCGDLADMILATGTRTGSPAPSAHRPPVTATATGCGHGHRTRTDTAGHGHGKPATVKTWRSAGTVAAGIKQKAGNP